jgi:hypothetical protein
MNGKGNKSLYLVIFLAAFTIFYKIFQALFLIAKKMFTYISEKSRK